MGHYITILFILIIYFIILLQISQIGIIFCIVMNVGTLGYGIIKKSGDFYIGLCLELNVASQGDSIEDATRMLQEACQEYLSFVKEEGIEDEIKPVSLDLLIEFLIGDEVSSNSNIRFVINRI